MRVSLRSKRLVPALVLGVLVLGIVAFAAGNPSEFDGFTGSSHTGCHGGTNPESATGTVQLVSSSGAQLSPGEVFTVTATVQSFNEAASKDVSLGFPTGTSTFADDDQFSFNVTRYDAVPLDGSGNSAPRYFQVTAPASEGFFTLQAVAILGDGGATLEWALGEITLEVAAGAPPGAPTVENLVLPSQVELGAAVQVEVDAYDAETSVVAVLVEHDSANHTVLDHTGNTYSYQFVPGQVGNQLVRVWAVDTEGKWNRASGSVSVVDTTAPSFGSAGASPEQLEVGDNVTFTAVVTDVGGLSDVVVRIAGVNVNLTMTHVGSDTFSATWVATSAGDFDWVVEATDASGNANTATGTFHVTGAPDGAAAGQQQAASSGPLDAMLQPLPLGVVTALVVVLAGGLVSKVRTRGGAGEAA